MGNLLRDIRFGLRMLANAPGFTAIVVLTLALGIGANTTIFTVANALLLEPPPYVHPQRLLLVYETNVADRSQQSLFSYPRFSDLRERQRSFSGIAAYTWDDFDLTGRGEPRQVSAGRVSWNFFHVLGVQAILGRTFRASEGQRGGSLVVMLSHRFWESEFSGAPNAVGQSLMLDSQSYTIVGVLPANFVFSPLSNDTQIWIPREFEMNIATPAHIQAGMGYLDAVARLAPGVSLAQAQSEMNVLSKEYSQENPARPDASPKWPITAAPLQAMMVAHVRTMVLVLLAAVGVVLLIACANVASLLLSRALKRKKEIAVRLALGAGRGTMVRQLLVESLVLAAVSGSVGILGGYASLRPLLRMAPAGLTQWSAGVALDWRVLGFAVLISLGSGVLFGLAPALQLSKTDLNSVLRDEGRGAAGGRRTKGTQNVLVMAQVALSLILLVGSGLLIRSFVRLMDAHTGFDPENVLTMQINLSPTKYATHAQMVTFYNELLRRTEAISGVDAAAISSALPPVPSRESPILAEGQPHLPLPQRPVTLIETISPDYTKVLRVPLERGREFTDEDDQTTPTVAMVNQAFVRRFWPNVDPIGKHIWLGTIPKPVEVVGVFRNEKNDGLNEVPAPEIFLPFPNLPWSHLRLSLRSAGGNPTGLLPAVRERLAGIDSDQPITHVQTMEQILSGARAGSRFTVTLFALFATVALALACVGIYGVISYAVTQRTHEIGVRMALGAQRRDVSRMVIREGMLLAAVGIVMGIAGALALTRFLRNMLFEIKPTDPVTFAGVAILLAIVALAACYLPARRAMKVDPMTALRYE